jgi:hypothetical protein
MVKGVRIRKRVNAELIVDGAITADKLAANSVVAGKISAGAISADEIAAGAITASKLAITDGANIAPDPTLTDDSAWGLGSGASFEPVSSGSGWRTLRVARVTGASGSFVIATGRWFKVNGGESLWLSWQGELLAGSGDVYVQITWSIDASSTLTTATVGLANTLNTIQTISGVLTVPVAARFARVQLIKRNNGSTDGRVGGVILRRAANGELIVDGAVTADKIAANAVTAVKIAADSVIANKIAANAVTVDKIAAGAVTAAKLSTTELITLSAQIKDGIITTAKIGNAQITDAKIATLDAGKITTGLLTAARINLDGLTLENSGGQLQIKNDGISTVKSLKFRPMATNNKLMPAISHGFCN